MKSIVAPALWGLGMLAVILDSRTAMAGAAEGAAMCLQTLIPGLFPLMVLSSLLASSLPRGGLVMGGLLGGYPVGARNVARAWQQGHLDREDAQRLALICNCAGPSFLFGAAGNCHPAALWGIYLLSVGALWLLLPVKVPAVTSSPLKLCDAIRSALGAMAGICGWVVLMRTLLAVLDRWVLWLLPQWGQAAVWGVLELTNGILKLGQLEERIRFVLAAAMIGFGGICVAMQTRSVTGELPMKLYFPGKAFQGCFSMALAALLSRTPLHPSVWAALAAVGGASALILGKRKKRCGNPTAVGV